jgi:hypothetical protein
VDCPTKKPRDSHFDTVAEEAVQGDLSIGKKDKIDEGCGNGRVAVQGHG